MEDNEYEVTFTFFVYADNDDDALTKVKKYIPSYEPDMPWVWKGTTLINKGDSNDHNQEA